MPVFRFDKVLSAAQSAKKRSIKKFLNLEGSITRGAASNTEQRKEQAEFRKKIKSKKQELQRIKSEFRVTQERTERVERKKRKKRVQQEIFQLERELRATKEQTEGEPATGALPDFVIVGAMKAGTTFLYDLLTRHPHVEPAAKKELHYFDRLFEEEDTEWYRRCFPPPRWKDGRTTLTGEATPYLSDLPVPERMAEVVPRVRLIALLRNPVDRTYSHYQQAVRKGRETQTFEEAIEEAMEAEKERLLGEEVEPSQRRDIANLDDSHRGYLLKGIYVDHLLRWSRFFPKEQMLVLKSEDLYESTPETLKLVLDFLDLPDWEPKTLEMLGKRNEGKYERKMDPSTRHRLDNFFEPHNQRLYEYLGVNFGW